MKFWRNTLIIVLCLSLAASSAVLWRVSGEDAAATSGACGSKSAWSYDAASGTLSITGTGEINDYNYNPGAARNAERPWEAYVSSVTALNIASGITVIGQHAFGGLTALTSLTVPDSVDTISSYAFYGCSSLKTVSLGSGLANLGYRSFGRCTAVESYTVSASNTMFSTKDGVLFDKGEDDGSGNIVVTELIKYPAGRKGSYAIPEGVTTIDEAFSGCAGLTAVTFPSSLETIGDEAFARCSSLKAVTITDKISSIGGGAFAACTSLPAFAVSSGNKYYSAGSDGALYNSTFTSLLCVPAGKTGSFTVPATVTSVYGGGDINDYSAFSGCASLTRVTIPAKVTEMGSYTFDTCTSLTGIDVNSANTLCVSKDGVLFNKDMTTLYCFPRGAGEDYTVPDTVTALLPYAFAGSAVTGVTMDAKLTEIAEYAFSGCASMKTCVLSSSAKQIDAGAFSGCSALKEMIIPVSVEGIDPSAFDGTTVTLAGNSDTLAQQYARAHGLNFRSVDTGVTVPAITTSTSASTSAVTTTKAASSPASSSSASSATLATVPEGNTSASSQATTSPASTSPAANVITTAAALSSAPAVSVSDGFGITVDTAHLVIKGVRSGLTVSALMGLLSVSSGSLIVSAADYTKLPSDSGFVKTGYRVTVLTGGYQAVSYSVSVAGDCDGDGFVTASDARNALRAAVCLDTLDTCRLVSCDIDGDNIVTSSDARRILRASVGLETL